MKDKRVIQPSKRHMRVKVWWQGAATERATAERKQKLLEALARKQDANLEASSEEEIRAMIDAL